MSPYWFMFPLRSPEGSLALASYTGSSHQVFILIFNLETERKKRWGGACQAMEGYQNTKPVVWRRRELEVGGRERLMVRKRGNWNKGEKKRRVRENGPISATVLTYRVVGWMGAVAVGAMDQKQTLCFYSGPGLKKQSRLRKYMYSKSL